MGYNRSMKGKCKCQNLARKEDESVNVIIIILSQKLINIK